MIKKLQLGPKVLEVEFCRPFQSSFLILLSTFTKSTVRPSIFYNSVSNFLIFLLSFLLCMLSLILCSFLTPVYSIFCIFSLYCFNILSPRMNRLLSLRLEEDNY